MRGLSSLGDGLRSWHRRVQDWDERLRRLDGELKAHRHPLRAALKTLEEQPAAGIQQRPPLPSTAETVAELQRRLAKELYRLEMDLQAGARIAGKACSCLEEKHNLGLEATAEELMGMDTRPVYDQILSWLRDHAAEFRQEEVAKRPPQHYQALAPEVRAFRKAVMGTERLGPMLTAEEKETVRNRLEQEMGE